MFWRRQDTSWRLGCGSRLNMKSWARCKFRSRPVYRESTWRLGALPRPSLLGPKTYTPLGRGLPNAAVALLFPSGDKTANPEDLRLVP